MRHLALSAALFLAACNSTKASTDTAVEVKADPIAVAPEPVVAAAAAPAYPHNLPR